MNEGMDRASPLQSKPHPFCQQQQQQPRPPAPACLWGPPLPGVVLRKKWCRCQQVPVTLLRLLSHLSGKVRQASPISALGMLLAVSLSSPPKTHTHTNEKAWSETELCRRCLRPSVTAELALGLCRSLGRSCVGTGLRGRSASGYRRIHTLTITTAAGMILVTGGFCITMNQVLQ